MKATAQTNVKEWYVQNIPNEADIVKGMNDITFEDVFNCLDNYGDIYKLMGVYDSIVRETVFNGLCQATGHTYNEVYNQWLNAK